MNLSKSLYTRGLQCEKFIWWWCYASIPKTCIEVLEKLRASGRWLKRIKQWGKFKTDIKQDEKEKIDACFKSYIDKIKNNTLTLEP